MASLSLSLLDKCNQSFFLCVFLSFFYYETFFLNKMIFLLLLYHVLIYKKENGTGLRLSIRIISECVLSYGENCNMSCSKNCVNQTCDRMTGICLNGCKDGTNCDQGIFFLHLISRDILLQNKLSFF